MDKLIELSQIITKNRLKKIDMLSPKCTNRGNKYLDVTDSLAKGNITSAEGIAEIIGYDKKSNNFHVFKLRLFDKLLNSLLFLDLDERKFHAYRMAVAECSRNIYCVRVLLLLSARESAAFVASKTLKKALKFELADIILFCARHLRTHYSLRGDKENFNYYNSLVNQYHKVLIAEDKAAEYLEIINDIEANSSSPIKENVSVVRDYLSKITLLLERHTTYQISIIYYRINGINAFLNRDYEAAIKNWDEFDSFIEKYKHFEYNVRVAESQLNKMDCYLHMRNFKEGSKCAQSCDKLFKLYSNNWFIFKEYYFLLALHTGNYKQATETINKVVGSSHFSQLAVNWQEKWRIFEAYLYILYKAGRLKGVAINEKSARFRLSKFVNSSPIFSKDKKGYNVSILIIQIMNWFIDKNYTALINQVDALERYVYRYFTNERDSRNFTFLKMIIEAERAGFKLNLTQKRTKVLYSNLQELQLTAVTGYDGLAIVPFTDLWEIVLGTLS